MILDKEVSIKMNSKHISRYLIKGYVCRVGEIISIKIEDLPRYSKCEVNVSCDDCNTCCRVLYINYTKLVEKFGKYRCFSCGENQKKTVLIERYGVDNPTKLKIFSNKISETYEKKSEEEKSRMISKQRETLFNNYGGWYVNTKEYREKLIKISLDRYGVDWPSKSDEVKNKVRIKRILNHGIIKISKKSWFGNKINGVHEKSNLRYQGTYELDFLNRYYETLDIKKIDPVEYLYENNIHHYHPDFYLPKYNLIVEVKSSYTYNYDLQKNLLKRDYCIKLEYDFLFLIDKDYSELCKVINK